MAVVIRGSYHRTLVLLLGIVLALAYPASSGPKEPDYWEHFEIPGYRAVLHEDFHRVVSGPAREITVKRDRPVRIALIFPSLDLSDAWARGHAGLVGRIAELKIPHVVDTLGTRHDDHALQLSHIETALARNYDYIILGPTEILVQMSAIEKVIRSPRTQIIIWNYTTPLRAWGAERYPKGQQPLAYVGFSHAQGGDILGRYFVDRLRKEVRGRPKVAHIRGIPGITDEQRSGVAKRHFTQAGFEIVHETFANWRRDLGYNATLNIVGAFPDVNHIHIVSTAMAIGAVEALVEMGRAGKILVNGWGGGAEEQLHLLEGRLQATVLRMQDDWGVALAEIIKYDLEGRRARIPLVYAGQMQLVDDTFTKGRIDDLLKYAFRYSGDLERYRRR